MALPLEGIRVLDLASMIAGPYGATMLGDMGADVIKIEPPRGDEIRAIGPGVGDDSGAFVGVNRNKRSIVLDLAHAEGREVYYRLVKTADVVVENLRAEAETKLGISYADTVKHKPDIIYISVSTFGESGPYAGRPGIDPLAQALTGFMSTTGPRGGPPVKTGVAVADATCANLVAYAAMLGLWVRQTQGIGQRIELSLIDGLIHIQPGLVGQYTVSNYLAPRVGNSSPFYGPYETYTCRDGKDIIVACFSNKWWRNLCRAIGRPDMLVDARFATNEARLANHAALDAEVGRWFAGQDADEAMRALAAADVIAAPVNDLAEAAADPQVRHNQMFVAVQHANLGTVEVGGVAPKLTRTPGGVHRAPPALGQHTDEVLASCGFDAAEIARLKAAGVIASATGSYVAAPAGG